MPSQCHITCASNESQYCVFCNPFSLHAWNFVVILTFSVIVSPPGKPVVIITAEMATTISLNISVDYLQLGNYTINITWEKSFPCSDSENGHIMTVAHASTEHMIQTITGLDEGSIYHITVTVSNAAGNATSDPITAMTMEAGNLHHICLPCILCIIIIVSAPSAPPEGLQVSNRMTFSITVKWQTVPCIHRNGNITEYAILIYHNNQKFHESSSGTTMITIHNLQPSTTYVISVAAVNSGGIGVYGNYTTSTLPCELCRSKCYIHPIAL